MLRVRLDRAARVQLLALDVLPHGLGDVRARGALLPDDTRERRRQRHRLEEALARRLLLRGLLLASRSSLLRLARPLLVVLAALHAARLDRLLLLFLLLLRLLGLLRLLLLAGLLLLRGLLGLLRLLRRLGEDVKLDLLLNKLNNRLHRRSF